MSDDLSIIDLNFADVPPDTSGPFPEGPLVMRITDAVVNPAKSADKFPSIKLTLMPYVAPGDPIATKKLNTWLSTSTKDFPRQQLKQAFEAIFQAPFETQMQGFNVKQLIDRTVVAVIGIDRGVDYQPRNPDGSAKGDLVKRDFNNVKGFMPHVIQTNAIQ